MNLLIRTVITFLTMETWVSWCQRIRLPSFTVYELRLCKQERLDSISSLNAVSGLFSSFNAVAILFRQTHCDAMYHFITLRSSQSYEGKHLTIHDVCQVTKVCRDPLPANNHRGLGRALPGFNLFLLHSCLSMKLETAQIILVQSL